MPATTSKASRSRTSAKKAGARSLSIHSKDTGPTTYSLSSRAITKQKSDDPASINRLVASTRSEAKERGLKRYFTGNMCKHGHVVERFVSDGSCVACRYRQISDWRSNPENQEKSRRYWARYKVQNYSQVLAAGRVYDRNKRDKSKKKQQYQKWLNKNPNYRTIYNTKRKKTIKVKAREILYNAVKRGDLKRLSCEICKAKKTEAHHKNYNRPLEVKWLCRKHHSEEHRRYA